MTRFQLIIMNLEQIADLAYNDEIDEQHEREKES